MSAVLENSLPEEIREEGLSSTPSPASRLRLFYASQRLLTRLTRVTQALYAGVWLGLLDAEDIDAIVQRFYEENQMYRTAEHNLAGFFPWESEIISENFGACRSVVVAAAGGGREMIALAQTGVGVDGFECNPGLVAKCQEFLSQAGVAGRILQSEPDEVPSGLQTYDGAIVGCGALGHISSRTNRVKFLKDLKTHLVSGAPLLLSVGRRPQGSRYHGVIYQIARAIRLLRGSHAPEVGDDPLDLYTHRFTEAEVNSELRDAGFAVVKSKKALEIYVVAQA